MSATLIQMHQGRKAFGTQVLFESAGFSVNEGEHVGVIGPNGAGKTTLFKLLNREQELDAGTIVRSKSLSLGYLSQHDQWAPEETGNSYLQRVSKIPLWEVKSAGRELQVSEEMFERPVTSLSGGYRMRIKLMGLLGASPNLMLLDEPTNYLDLETTLLLERFLQDFNGAFLLISHDREFLRRTTDHILEVEGGEITKYNGHIDDYFEQKDLLREQAQAAARNQAEKRKALLDFITRFGAKATKARQAQSRMKTLQKMEAIELKEIPVTARIKIPEPHAVGKSVIRLSRARFGYGAKAVLDSVNIEIQRGDHVAVIGLNGAGKSTLLKGLAGTLAPLAGARELGHQVELAIFNQHVVEDLDPGQTVFESLMSAAHPAVTPQEVRAMAGALLFSSDHIEKRISVLSGGEKSRVALGRVLLKKVPFILLDEPTNHLDFQTVEALTQALRDYKGTLIVVSHDRGFVRRVASKMLEVAGGGVHLYPGTYDEYVWRLQNDLAPAESAPAPKAAAATPDLKPGKQKKERDKQLRALERQLTVVEKRMQELEAANSRLNSELVAGTGDARAIAAEMARNSTELVALEAEWLALSEEKESL